MAQSDWVEKAQNIHIFISVEKLGEVSTQKFIQLLWVKGKVFLFQKLKVNRSSAIHARNAYGNEPLGHFGT
ncbi:hypothetical protein [Ornithobacterium rhinotracheale]|uniref:hypothetical protein n=1 Tax=Ornithobacterium rhinotracheale TaxID=28251 RepID=UPI001FF25DE0|nr:hypothetical protein [Ornithobacterium rhinotracheale]MCK0206071.1 hypothetical protein [Ornithobacterium rhinotracheale]